MFGPLWLRLQSDVKRSLACCEQSKPQTVRKKKIDVNDKTTPQCQRLGSRETTCVLLVWSGLRLTTWLAHAVGGSDHVGGVLGKRGARNQQGGRLLSSQMICYLCWQSTRLTEKSRGKRSGEICQM